jgi:transcriptional regulator with XRE-family HTH domain
MNDTFSTGLQQVLAANLRRLRIARRLSLSELARATSMSKATLSGIENARANPTVETLAALAAALRVSVGELLDELPLGEVRLVRGAQARYRDGLAERLLESGHAEVSELALEPGRLVSGDARAAGTRIGVYVLDGTVLAGPVERVSELGVGDYMSFPADVPHLLEAGRRGARVLRVSAS